jgi:hypothetical protein
LHVIITGSPRLRLQSAPPHSLDRRGVECVEGPSDSKHRAGGPVDCREWALERGCSHHPLIGV